MSFSDSATDTTKNSHAPRARQQRYSVVWVGVLSALQTAPHPGLGFGTHGLSVHCKGKDGKEKPQSYPRP